MHLVIPTLRVPRRRSRRDGWLTSVPTSRASIGPSRERRLVVLALANVPVPRKDDSLGLGTVTRTAAGKQRPSSPRRHRPRPPRWHRPQSLRPLRPRPFPTLTACRRALRPTRRPHRRRAGILGSILGATPSMACPATSFILQELIAWVG